MARIKQGFLGNASGKLGSVVFSKWRNLETARQYQPDIQDANSPDQQKQRTRMVALLQFLKPLNNTFIKFFNASIAKGSTPWAVAIKENMKGVSPDGIFTLQNLRLGTPMYPPFTIIESIYNPFIDQIQVVYNPPMNYTPNDPFLNIGCAALGKYKSVNDSHNFDVRHQLCFMPMGIFFSSFYDDFSKQYFFNWWKEGMLWFMYFDRNNTEHMNNPNANLTEPAPFTLTSMVEGFDTNIEVNPVPVEAISWEYVQRDNKWYLVFTLDYSKITLPEPINFTIIINGVNLVNGQHSQSPSMEWNLGSESKQIEIGEAGFHGSRVLLYAVYRNDGLRVSRFNRFYINSGTNNVEYPYFKQIFDCNYSLPSSFILYDNECGFCGIINDLFDDFINLYEQGVIQYHTDPIPTIQHILTLGNSINGTVNILNYFRKDNLTYFFLVGEKATLNPLPAPGYNFSKWAGTDANDVQLVEPGSYELLMDKNRSVYAEYVEIPIPVTEYTLTLLPSINGTINVSNYLTKVENVYTFSNGANAMLSPQPEPGFNFLAWAGPDAADVQMTEPGSYILLMNKNRVMYADFMPL